VSQYGQRNADVIISLLNNQFFGRVSSQKTAEYVSKLFGKTDQYFESHSESRGESNTITTNSKNEGTSKSFAIQERDRIKPQDILQFDVGHFCGILVEGSN
jgi:type IV secretory pathway TraG/TraD family ATPase VirD4